MESECHDEYNERISLLPLKRIQTQRHVMSSRKRHSSLEPSTYLKILSATYGPSEGHRLLTGELCHDESYCKAFSRDVSQYIEALLIDRYGQGNELDLQQDKGISIHGMKNLIQIKGRNRNFIPLMVGRKMNVIFGDPCPGTSKRLNIQFVSYNIAVPDGGICVSDIHFVSFAEHDHVVLRPNIITYQSQKSTKSQVYSQVEKSQILKCSLLDGTITEPEGTKNDESITPFAESLDINSRKLSADMSQSQGDSISHANIPWCVPLATSEIVLHITLPFLTVKEILQCKLVCTVWRNTIRELGVAKVIDVNDDTTFPNFTLLILRGLLAQSHRSLKCLYLSGFGELAKDDLHPAIPYLKKLENLDISRCYQLDDSTLLLLSLHVSSTLEVFYLKGLRDVTDVGITAIAKACLKLQVLEISNILISDEGGIEIGENLIELRALYMRDNYLLTNKSVDVITQKCSKLAQLTIWGCIRLQHLSFQPVPGLASGISNLVILNLWGCHSLTDEIAQVLGGFPKLRSLIVSECHKLTNGFLFALAHKAPQINHLHLRYCRMITDTGIDAIANSMSHLFSLDLSFCSRVTSSAIVSLLSIRQDALQELRLQNCSHLDFSNHEIFNLIDPIFMPREDRDGSAGHELIHVLGSIGNNSHLSLLDLRSCGGCDNVSKGFKYDDPFVQGMETLNFIQVIPGLFQREAKPDSKLYNSIVTTLH